MNKLVNDFIEYLLTIGILGKESLGEFKAVGNPPENEKSVEILFKNSMSDSLINFIFSLGQDQKRLLTLNIIKKFIENTKERRIKALKTSIILTNAKRNQGSSKEQFKYAFKLWKFNSIYHTLQPEAKKITIFEPTLDNENNQNITFNTFQPSLRYAQTEPTEIQTKDNPKLITHYKKLSQQKSRKSRPTSLHQNKSISFLPFHQRQKSFMIKKYENLVSYETEEEKIMSELCTFVPRTNKSYKTIQRFKTTSSSPHIRLYNESKERRNRSVQRQKKYEEEIKEKCNRNVYSIDPEKIKQLYNEYKLKAYHKELLAKKVDQENGHTYQPYVSHDKYHKRVNTSFFEREKEYLEEKKRLRDTSEKKYKTLQETSQVGYERWGKEKKSELCKKVIQRLYDSIPIDKPKKKLRAVKTELNLTVSNISASFPNKQTKKINSSSSNNKYSFTTTSGF